MQEKPLSVENWPPCIDPLFLDLPGMADSSERHSHGQGHEQITLSGNVFSSTTIEYLQAPDPNISASKEAEEQLEIQRADYRMSIITEVCARKEKKLL